jgi:hypothetical protein
MRKQTLLLTAAIGVAGAATTMAQVYSVNAVGYVNQTLVHGSQIIANPLDAGAGNNTVVKLFPGVPDGTFVYKYDMAVGFIGNNYDAGWGDEAMTLVPGEGAFVVLPGTAADLKITYIGDVALGSASNMQLKKGLQLVGSKVPQAGKIEQDLKFPVADGDFIYRWDIPTQAYVGYNYDAGWGEEPTIAVAEGFFVQKANDANWDRNFSIAGP